MSDPNCFPHSCFSEAIKTAGTSSLKTAALKSFVQTTKSCILVTVPDIVKRWRIRGNSEDSESVKNLQGIRCNRSVDALSYSPLEGSWMWSYTGLHGQLFSFLPKQAIRLQETEYGRNFSALSSGTATSVCELFGKAHRGLQCQWKDENEKNESSCQLQCELRCA